MQKFAVIASVFLGRSGTSIVSFQRPSTNSRSLAYPEEICLCLDRTLVLETSPHLTGTVEADYNHSW